MKASLRERLTQVAERHEEVGLLLSDPGTFSDQNRFRNLSQEYAQLEPVVKAWRDWQDAWTGVQRAMRSAGPPWRCVWALAAPVPSQLPSALRSQLPSPGPLPAYADDQPMRPAAARIRIGFEK